MIFIKVFKNNSIYFYFNAIFYNIVNYQCFILIELKHMINPEMKTGQRLALERLCDAVSKPCIIFLGIHDSYDEDDIKAHNCVLHQFYFKGEWKKPNREYGLLEAIIGFVDKVENGFYSNLN